MKQNFKVTIPLALFVTFVAILYQRGTGPTYPKKVYIQMEQQKVKVPFIRSHVTTGEAPIDIPLLATDMRARVYFKRFPTNDSWTTKDFVVKGSQLSTTLPAQPPAGKLQYYIDIFKGDQKIQTIASENHPILIRYKGEVPTAILAPHIFFMFFSMLLSALAGFEALFKTQSYLKIGAIATGCLVIGGMILGPLVQKNAFGVYWAGFPFDWDLTDNKLLISVIFWALALAMNLRVRRPQFVVLASAVLIAMYSIPHSTMGSQYNYEAGKVETDK